MINKKHVAAMIQIAVLAWSGATLAAGKVYVANEGANTVNILDADSLQGITKVNVGKMPHNVQVSPDGKAVWVTNSGSVDNKMEMSGQMDMHGDDHQHASAKPGEVWVIDTQSKAITGKAVVGHHPAHVVLSRDGKYAYVTNSGDNTVSVIDVQTMRSAGLIQAGHFPHGLRVSPDGNEIYVANMKGGNVSVIDTTTNTEKMKIEAGKMPAQVAFTPDGKKVFVSLSGENAVAAIDTATHKVVTKINVGPGPIQLFATPDSSTVFVANQGSKAKPGNSVSMIDVASLQVRKTIPTGNGAHGVVVDKDGRYAYVTNAFAHSVSMIDIKTGTVLKTTDVDLNPNGISWGQ